MKKIKSIKQLKAEKNQIKERQLQLEEKIRMNWKALKEDLRPLNIAKDGLNSMMQQKTAEHLYGDGFMRNAFSYGVTLLANKVLNKVGNQWGRHDGDKIKAK